MPVLLNVIESLIVDDDNDHKLKIRSQDLRAATAAATDGAGSDAATMSLGADAGPRVEEFRFHETRGGEMRKWFADDIDKLRVVSSDVDEGQKDQRGTAYARSDVQGSNAYVRADEQRGTAFTRTKQPPSIPGARDRRPRSTEDVVVEEGKEEKEEKTKKADGEIPLVKESLPREHQEMNPSKPKSSHHKRSAHHFGTTQDPFINLAGPHISAFFDDFRPIASASRLVSQDYTSSSSSKRSSFDLTAVASNLILMGVFPLFDLRVIVDPRDSSQYAMQIKPWDPWKLPSLPAALLKGGQSNLEAIRLYNQFCDHYRDIFSIFAGKKVDRAKACRYVDANRMRLLIQPSAKSLELASLQDSADTTYWQ